uniref:Transmembrane protein 232-like n=1 Tax=Phallusia mammillata TaxID=59560 RepID=A0A6F9DVL2_9ASCI|nr:transmembrane protein 232-like [Phallusia mammillata]
MPVLKVPVVHKFGIISQSQRLELQERLIRQAYDEGKSTDGHVPSQKNPLEVSEKFVQKYNLAGLKEKEILQDKAMKMLERAKRRCGLPTCGEGNHVDLPLGWSELAVLAQCKGKLQEDCFTILCTSLDQAPLAEDNIPTLFFLAESTLYWLRTDALKQPHLRGSEVKLLKMGQLVFARLLFHHLSGHLRGLAEFKTRLHVYIDGIKDQQMLYKSYPGIWLSLRFVSRVGEIVIGPYAAVKGNAQEADRVSESVPGLAACVYRALCVWRCTSTTKIGLKKAIMAMILASHELKDQDWINGYLSISLLGEAAKLEPAVCKALQDLARGVQVSISTDGIVQSAVNHFPSTNTETVPNTQQTTNSAQPHVDEKFQAEIDGLVSDFDNLIKSPLKTEQNTDKQKPATSKLVSTATTRNTTASQLETSKSKAINLNRPQMVNQPLSGAGSWCWETVYQYTQVLADICLNGSSSYIQKMALLGKWQDADVTTFRAGAANPCAESCGLVDLLEYRGPAATVDIAAYMQKYEWTWKVRYGAVSGLIKLIHSLHGNKERDGMRSAAWSLVTALQECAVTEDRVLEAIRVGQVETLQSWDSKRRMSIWSRIAHGLSESYIVTTSQSPSKPPQTSPTPTPASSPKRHEPRTTPSPRGKTPSPKKAQVNRPTIREDIAVHTTSERCIPDFKTRTSLDLTRVVADQWRKDMVQAQKEEEEQMLQDLQIKQKMEERAEEEKIRKRQNKLKGRATAGLLPYQVVSSEE